MLPGSAGGKGGKAAALLGGDEVVADGVGVIPSQQSRRSLSMVGQQSPDRCWQVGCAEQLAAEMNEGDDGAAVDDGADAGIGAMTIGSFIEWSYRSDGVIVIDGPVDS